MAWIVQAFWIGSRGALQQKAAATQYSFVLIGQQQGDEQQRTSDAPPANGSAGPNRMGARTSRNKERHLRWLLFRMQSPRTRRPMRKSGVSIAEWKRNRPDEARVARRRIPFTDFRWKGFRRSWVLFHGSRSRRKGMGTLRKGNAGKDHGVPRRTKYVARRSHSMDLAETVSSPALPDEPETCNRLTRPAPFSNA